MVTIYRNNDILHGCNDIERIFNDSLKLRESGQRIESYIYLVGCYASATGDRVLKSSWRMLRKLYNDGMTGKGLYYFKGIYNGCCCRIRYCLGFYAWQNTLTFEY